MASSGFDDGPVMCMAAGSSHSHEVYKGHIVPPRRASIGIATLGDKFHTLIPGMAPTPTCGGQVIEALSGWQVVCDFGVG